MPLRFVRELTAAERVALTELYKMSADTHLVHRSHAILFTHFPRGRCICASPAHSQGAERAAVVRRWLGRAQDR